MAEIQKLTVGGVTYDLKDAVARGYAPIIGTGVPTTLTAGLLGQIYVESSTGWSYVCVQDTPTYVWVLVTNVLQPGTGVSAAQMDACDASGDYSLATGMETEASGAGAVASGFESIASGYSSHAAGERAQATGCASSAEGNQTVASGDYSHAEGYTSYSTGQSSHTEGAGNTASGLNSHAEGGSTLAYGEGSHAEGGSTQARGAQSHAEGYSTKALGDRSHAEGYSNTSSGNYSHSEGQGVTASGTQSHAEGLTTEASGVQSHAEGRNTKAKTNYTHAEGFGTVAALAGQHAQGKFNVERASGVADVVGWGTDDNNRKNISTLDTTGDLHLAGNLYMSAANDGTGGVLANRVTYGSADPTSSTAGAVGQIYVNTTSGNVFSCVTASSPYSWVNLSSGGGIPVLSGASAPTSSTVGLLGQLYICTTDLLIYCCTQVSPYTWQLVSNREVLIEAGTTPYATISAYLDAGRVVYANEPGTGTDIYTYVCTGRHLAADMINYLDFSAVYASAGWNFKMFDCDENDTWTYGGRNWTIPYPPTVNGTYRLTCTVSGGVPTYSWTT